jgi:hypothetical protein
MSCQRGCAYFSASTPAHRIGRLERHVRHSWPDSVLVVAGCLRIMKRPVGYWVSLVARLHH